MMKTIAVLGATGSVGMQALDVARKRGYRVNLLSAKANVDLLAALAREFLPPRVAIADESLVEALRVALSDTPCRIYAGGPGILEAIRECERDTVYVNAILGQAGLLPSLAVIDKGERLALANKETLVCAGELVMARARGTGAEILPVDSEHSAIFQCLKGGAHGELSRILLTASGGPFFGYSRDELKDVTLAESLAHPTWKMGKKITVDSATMMNKGFEILEAVHLFGVPASKIEVLVHRESIIHSAVEYIDNTVIAELSVPDMRACVQYAVDYPERADAAVAPLDLFSVGTLSFHKADEKTFTPLRLAREAAMLGGGAGALLNAVDEVAVQAHLSGELSFLGILEVLEEAFNRMKSTASSAHTLEEILNIDREARMLARTLILNT